MCIPYHGGKRSSAAAILELLPSASLFVDVFGGSGRVAIEAVKSRRYKAVVYNDLDDRMLDLLMTLKESPREFRAAALSLPVSRTLYGRLRNGFSEDRIQRAAETLFLLAFSGQFVLPRGSEKDEGAGSFCRVRLSERNSPDHSRAFWVRLVESVSRVHGYLLGMTLENLPAEEILKRFGGKTWGAASETLFFCDPPYGATQLYRHTVDKRILNDALAWEGYRVAVLGDKTEAETYPNAASSAGIETRNKASREHDTVIFANFELEAELPLFDGVIYNFIRPSRARFERMKDAYFGRTE